MTTPRSVIISSDDRFTHEQMTYIHVQLVLYKHAGNKTYAADELGISLRTLQRWLRKWKRMGGVRVNLDELTRRYSPAALVC